MKKPETKDPIAKVAYIRDSPRVNRDSSSDCRFRLLEIRNTSIPTNPNPLIEPCPVTVFS